MCVEDLFLSFGLIQFVFPTANHTLVVIIALNRVTHSKQGSSLIGEHWSLDICACVHSFMLGCYFKITYFSMEC